MEDIIILLLTAAVMIGSAVSSANKKKKEAAGRAGRPPAKSSSAKSIGELLEELANEDDEQPYRVETEPQTETETEYFEEYASSEELQSAAERLEALAYKPVERVLSPRIAAAAAEEEEELVEATEASQTDINEIIRDFDLKRAVIEAEILKPKFEQY